MVRANEQPEMGDVNRASFADQLGRVATVLEPVTLFGDYQSFQGFIVDDDEDHERRLDRWERRLFLAQAQPRAAGIR